MDTEGGQKRPETRRSALGAYAGISGRFDLRRSQKGREGRETLSGRLAKYARLRIESACRWCAAHLAPFAYALNIEVFDMSDPLHNGDPRTAALQIEHHPAGAWLISLLKCPVADSNKVRLRGRYVVQTWTALVQAVEGTGVCVGPSEVVALASLLTTRPRSASGPFLRLDWLDGSGAPLPGSRSWSPPMTDAGPVDLAPAPSDPWGSQELASDVIRAQADLQRAHAATIAAGVRELSHGHVAQVAELRKTIHELQSIVIAQSGDLRGLAGAAMKHESRGAARAYELALEHVQRAHEVQIQAERADSGGVGLALAAELAPPVLALARDVVAVRKGEAPPSASPAPSTALQPSRVQLDATTLRAAVVRLLRDAASGHDEARAMVREVVAALSGPERAAVAPLLLG